MFPTGRIWGRVQLRRYLAPDKPEEDIDNKRVGAQPDVGIESREAMKRHLD
jgi:hypothetical protein